METAKIETKTLILSLAAVICVEAAVKFTAHLIPNAMIILGGARLLESVLLILVVYLQNRDLSVIGLARPQAITGLKKGMIWSAGVGMAALIIFALMYAVGINPLNLLQVQLPSNPVSLVYFFAVGAFVGPIAEEVFFRGILYGFFRRWGVAAALILSTLIFAAAHSVGQGIPFVQIAGGIVFAAAYAVEGSLIVPITIHVLGNTALFSLSLVF